MTGGIAFTIMQDYVELHKNVIVSNEDAIDIRWNYYINGRGYAMFTGGPRSLIHRWVLERYYKITLPKHLVVDHINGNKLDNRRDNLQLVTQSVNRLKGHSGFKNSRSSIYRRVGTSRPGEWRSTIPTKAGLFMATFKEEKDAAIFADLICYLLCDDQTLINFPELKQRPELWEGEMERLGLSEYYFNLLKR